MSERKFHYGWLIPIALTLFVFGGECYKWGQRNEHSVHVYIMFLDGTTRSASCSGDEIFVVYAKDLAQGSERIPTIDGAPTYSVQCWRLDRNIMIRQLDDRDFDVVMVSRN